MYNHVLLGLNKLKDDVEILANEYRLNRGYRKFC